MGGLPRSGSTLLGAILNQNKRLHVSTTSNVPEMVVEHIKQLENMGQSDDWYAVMYDQLHVKYHNHVGEYIVEKSRSWNGLFPDICAREDNPKLIAPIRPLKEIVASAIRLFEKNPQNLFSQYMGDADLDEKGMRFYEFYMESSYKSISHTFDNYPENICIVDFHDLMHRPTLVLDKIYKFCKFPHDTMHDLGNIKVREQENDKIWDIHGLHDVKPKIVPPAYTPENYFGKELGLFLDNVDTINQKRGIIA
jgi:sulfotransferase